jgi:hypothetical protein
MADLSDAILKSTNLRGADLRGANLRGADLSFVDLRGANLKDASLSLADLPNFQIAPEKGSFIAWKAVKGAILELLVPAWAYRTTSLTSRKIRVSQAKVVRAYPEQGYESQTFAGLFATEFRYTVGEYATADRFNDDIREECTHGIHCFITRKEAEEWV